MFVKTLFSFSKLFYYFFKFSTAMVLQVYWRDILIRDEILCTHLHFFLCIQELLTEWRTLNPACVAVPIWIFIMGNLCYFQFALHLGIYWVSVYSWPCALLLICVYLYRSLINHLYNLYKQHVFLCLTCKDIGVEAKQLLTSLRLCHYGSEFLHK